MLLRTRLLLVFALAAGVLLASLGMAVVAWRAQQQGRFDQLVLDTQTIAWRRFEATAVERLAAAAAAVAANPDLVRALSRDDPAAVRTSVAPGLGLVQLDACDSGGRIIYTSSLTLAQELQLDAAGIHRVLTDGEPVTGLMPTGPDAFSVVAAVPVRRGARVIGGVTLGMPVNTGLAELSQGLGREVALVDLRGRAVGGNGAALYNAMDPELPLRRAGSIELTQLGHGYRIAAIPALGHDGRQVGSFVTLQDVTAERALERHWMLALAGAALLVVAGILAALFAHLRRSFAPLAEAVEVLTALSRGDTSVRVHTQQLDEAGQIAEGVERLRSEMLNLQVLREERQCERWRQEKIIRDELHALAGSLGENDRRDILSDLETALSNDDDAEGGNQLAVLGFVMGRLSARIRDQQQAEQAFAALQQELEIARRMQLSVLPRQFPQRADVSLASFILPAQEVGGDFYDYFPLDDERIGVVIADVSGKGVPAAFFMAICRTLLKASARFQGSPAATLARVNSLLAAQNEEMMFVTLFYGILEPDSGRFVYANGGHNMPVLLSGGDARRLPPTRGMALAVDPDAQFTEGCVLLQAGDVLFLYTDGITEARSPDGALFGEPALRATLTGTAPDASADAYQAQVFEAIQQFMRGAPQADDITCVTLRYAGPPSGAATYRPAA